MDNKDSILISGKERKEIGASSFYIAVYGGTASLYSLVAEPVKVDMLRIEFDDPVSG